MHSAGRVPAQLNGVRASPTTCTDPIARSTISCSLSPITVRLDPGPDQRRLRPTRRAADRHWEWKASCCPGRIPASRRHCWGHRRWARPRLRLDVDGASRSAVDRHLQANARTTGWRFGDTCRCWNRRRTAVHFGRRRRIAEVQRDLGAVVGTIALRHRERVGQRGRTEEDRSRLAQRPWFRPPDHSVRSVPDRQPIRMSGCRLHRSRRGAARPGR